ncbi:hypothetical protein Q5752_006963 [Cryptotrichosporon argae]
MSLALLALVPLLAARAAAAHDVGTITTAPANPTGGVHARQAASSTTYETTSPLPLTEYFYPYDEVPYQVNPYQYERGPQTGYNQCNSTTEGADSQCQTGIVNWLDDFCLWGAPGQGANETIGDIEAAVVSYCTRSGHGSRVLPPGTITGAQFVRTDAYIQIVGWFNQTAIGLTADDTGGELDPHGADYLGNPLGGLMYSNGFSNSSAGGNSSADYVQTQSWNEFVGSNQFCVKLCNPNYDSGSTNYCQNIYDLLGCTYNMPADYADINGQFLACDSDLQDEVGTYTSGGQTLTWSQPSSLAATETIPWTPRVPSSSNCVYYHSTDLFPTEALGYQSTAVALDDVSLTTTAATTPASYGTVSGAPTAASGSGSGSASGSSATGASSSAAKSGSASASAKSGSSSASSSASTSGAKLNVNVVGGLAGFAGFAVGLAAVLC